MRKIIISLVILLPTLLPAQYYGERVTEKSFEQSGLYFQSHFLNTFGLNRFKNVAVGLFDDPFLNLHINPANLPDLGDKASLIYIDFRGDRTEMPFSNYRIDYGFPLLDDVRLAYPYPYDPRWFSQTRVEPEPVFSLGFLSYLSKSPASRLFFGATYQIIHKQEPFYTVPSWIYNARAGYDALGERVADIPIVERSAGEDEMINEAHLLSSFLGLKLSKGIDLGLGINGVVHSRDGGYLREVNSPYTNINEWRNEYMNLRDRTQDYDHYDLNGGIRVNFSRNSFVGIKGGFLKGTADQQFLSQDNSLYEYEDVNNQNNNSYGFNDAMTEQNWHQKGDEFYGRVHFTHKATDTRTFSGYVRLAENTTDLSNSTVIADTSFYSSNWQYDTQSSYYLSESALHDVRTGTGERKRTTRQAMLNHRWQVSPKSAVILGIYYAAANSKINSLEPVSASRFSRYDYYYTGSQQDTTRSSYSLTEEKTLHWKYESNYWTVQIPILLQFQLNPNWKITAGINRSLRNWDIREVTTAIFDLRRVENNGVIDTSTNFGERYTEPRKRNSENNTDLISSLEVAVSNDLTINLLVNPELNGRFRVAQWWLGFRSSF